MESTRKSVKASSGEKDKEGSVKCSGERAYRTDECFTNALRP